MCMNRYVLMLEDDSDDRYITSETLTSIGLNVPVWYVVHSNELFSELQSGTKPMLVIADANSKPDDGLTVLKRLKENTDTAAIPVVILTEQRNDAFANACYAAGASTVITKPMRDDHTARKIEAFFRYWLDVAEV